MEVTKIIITNECTTIRFILLQYLYFENERVHGAARKC